MRNVTEKGCRENIHTHLTFNNCAIYGITWKNTVQPCRPQMTIQYHVIKVQFACWITEARIDIHTQNM
jgi:hypothetical protein